MSVSSRRSKPSRFPTRIRHKLGALPDAITVFACGSATVFLCVMKWNERTFTVDAVDADGRRPPAVEFDWMALKA